MNKLRLSINSSRSNIPIIINHDIRDELTGFLARSFSHHAIYVIADRNLQTIYGAELTAQLSRFPRFGGVLSFPAGEESKSRETKARLEDRLLEQAAGRDSVIIALGGGVTGDLAGFVAATLHRGVPLIHLPTSLLAQVDSSIGGKVGINHPLGKNLIGAFYQPRAVFTGIRFLDTLPEIEFRNGLGEVIKYAVILDADLWETLEQTQNALINKDPQTLEQVVSRCVKLKTEVVEKDETETRYRSILNFGHTYGHAVEQLSRYRIKHGFAVAAGMRVAARLSHRLLGYPATKVERIDRTLEAFQLIHTDTSDFPIDAIWEALGRDKKARERTPRFTLIDGDGHPRLFYPVTKAELTDALSDL